VSALHADALAALTSWPAPDGVQERLRRDYVAHLREHPDAMTRGCYPDHVTASTLILSEDASRALLTLHAKAGAWFQVGGHCEPQDTSLVGAARREAVEESGIVDLMVDPVPVQLSTHDVPFCDPRGGTRHLDVRFVAVAPRHSQHAVSEESLDVRWWPVDALPTDAADVHELVRLACERAASRH
jgi:8-oxo-dGTP pyrophosphatase MutT (NUDIX family)